MVSKAQKARTELAFAHRMQRPAEEIQRLARALAIARLETAIEKAIADIGPLTSTEVVNLTAVMARGRPRDAEN